jgi:hypothetical protein
MKINRSPYLGSLTRTREHHDNLKDGGNLDLYKNLSTCFRPFTVKHDMLALADLHLKNILGEQKK